MTKKLRHNLVILPQGIYLTKIYYEDIIMLIKYFFM